jgi:hypothetical protein
MASSGVNQRQERERDGVKGEGGKAAFLTWWLNCLATVATSHSIKTISPSEEERKAKSNDLSSFLLFSWLLARSFFPRFPQKDGTAKWQQRIYVNCLKWIFLI